MTKTEEIAILTAACKKLGPDSYLGPALADLIPYLDGQLRSDICPDLLGLVKEREAHAERLRTEIRERETYLASMKTTITDREAILAQVNDGIKSAGKRLSDLALEINRTVDRLCR